MVQELSKIINFPNFSRPHFVTTLETFSCCKDEDVKRFLVEDAINYERVGEARTFLILNDDAWSNGNIQIDGYFSLAIKIINFSKDLGSEFSFKIFERKRNSAPAYLIGQLAKSDSMPKGFGCEILQVALSKIRLANEQVGGKLIYLDCKPELISYYVKHGFKYFQTSKTGLKQMYMTV